MWTGIKPKNLWSVGGAQDPLGPQDDAEPTQFVGGLTFALAASELPWSSLGHGFDAFFMIIGLL